jgi:AcrR family transcriptional regulator
MRKTAELRKEEIVMTVLKQADAIGPDRVTTSSIAAEIGITQAALFRHFSTKAELWLAVAEHVSRLLSDAWSEALRTEDKPLMRIRALVGAQLRQIGRTPAMPMLLFSRELNVDNQGLREAFRRRLVEFQTLLVGEIRNAAASGQIRKDIVPADAAILFTSLIQGMAIRWSLGARDFDLVYEGLHLFDVQLRLMATQEKGGS